mgnify:CR=1 FL=1
MNKIAKDTLKPILGPILTIYNYIMCAIKMITNFPKCIFYYLVDCIMNILYLPFSLLFWAFSLQSLEKQFWRTIKQVDSTIKSFTGYNVIEWSNDTKNKCYRCKNKNDKPGKNWLDKYLEELEKEREHTFTFFEIVLSIIFIGFMFFIGYYNLNLQMDESYKSMFFTGVSYMMSLFLVALIHQIEQTSAAVLFLATTAYHGLQLSKSFVIQGGTKLATTEKI